MTMSPDEAAAHVRAALAASPPRSSGARWLLGCDGSDAQGVVLTLVWLDESSEPVDFRQQTLLFGPSVDAEELTRLVTVAAAWVHAAPPRAEIWAPSQVVRPELLGLGLDESALRRALEEPADLAGLVGPRLAADHAAQHGLPSLSGAHHADFGAIWEAVTYAPNSASTVEQLVALARAGDGELVGFISPFVQNFAETFDSMPPALQRTRPERRILSAYAARLVEIADEDPYRARLEELRDRLGTLDLAD